MHGENTVFDRCETCGHTWHGLICSAQKIRQQDGYTVKGLCNCPSQFQLKDD